MKTLRTDMWSHWIVAPLMGLAVSLAVSDRVLGQIGFVLETEQELSLTADFNGDGLEDAALVNRASGGVSLALGGPAGSVKWTGARAAGLAPVSSVSAGRWSDVAHDSLAFAGPLANRVHWVEAPSGPQFNPKELTINPPVPWQAVAIDVGGAGNTALDDFLVICVPGPGIHSTWTAIRNADGNPNGSVLEQALPAALGQLNRITITPDAKRYVAATYAVGERLELRAWDFSSGAAVQVTRLTNLPPAAHYVVGRFGVGNEPMAVVYSPGSLTARVGRLDLPAPLVRNAILPASLSATLGSLRGMRTLPTSGRAQIASFGTIPGRVVILGFDGIDTFSVVETLSVPEDEEVTGLLVQGDGGIQALTGEHGVTQHFHRYAWTGNRHTLVQSGVLPALNPATLGANVFQFDREPFVTPRPGLLRTDRVDDWSSQFALGGLPGNVLVTQERFVDSARGLSQPGGVNLGPAHPLTDFGLVNQYQEALSLFSFSPSLGNTVSEVSISPVPGTYRSGVAISFRTSQVGHQVYYRLSPDAAWLPYAGTPIQLFQDTTVEFYGKPLLGNAKSMIHQARYEFSIPPARLDSDQDGVPDFVERQLGLDSAGGADTDQDQATDLEEILAGTDPANPASYPKDRPTSQTDAGLTFELEPLPLHPTTGSVTGAVANTSVRLFGLDGNQVGAGQIPLSFVLGGGRGVARLQGVRPDEGIPFLIAATDPHFAIRGGNAGANQGRELIRLIRLQPPAQPVVNYVYGSHGGTPAAETQGWINALRGGVAAAAPEPQEYSLAARDALLARLFERGVALSLISRGLTNAPLLSLFPFRVPDSGRWTPPLDRWRAGASFDGSTNPPAPFGTEEMSALHDALTVRVEQPSTPELTALVGLAEQIYLLSSRSNHLVPPRYPLPFDALREWIWTGVLPGGYATDLPTSPAQLALAAAGVNQALATLPDRERVRWILRVRPDSFTSFCATLETTDPAPTLVHLFDREGGAFVFPDGFQLSPGTLVWVEGFLTAAQGGCPGTKVEVLVASVVSLPSVVAEDANRNGIPDDWERLFLGGLSPDPLQDSDHDLVSDLSEFLGGSDPHDPAAVPVVPIADVTPPNLKITVTETGEVEVEWQGKGNLPPQLANLNYVVLSGADLDSILRPVASHPASGAGRVALRLPPPSTAQATFYRLSLCWGDCGE